MTDVAFEKWLAGKLAEAFAEFADHPPPEPEPKP